MLQQAGREDRSTQPERTEAVAALAAVELRELEGLRQATFSAEREVAETSLLKQDLPGLVLQEAREEVMAAPEETLKRREP